MSQRPYLNKAEELLEKSQLKKTDLRTRILEIFISEKKAFSQADVISMLSEKIHNVDRVSIYRNLLQLKENGIIHEVNSNKYVCCTHDCNRHAHLLLYCETCEKHGEIKDHQKISSFFEILGDFRFLSKNKSIFIKGICNTCEKTVVT